MQTKLKNLSRLWPRKKEISGVNAGDKRLRPRFLRIHPDHSLTEIEVDAHGSIRSTSRYDADSKSFSEKNSFVLLVPGNQITLREVKLPKTSHRALQKAIPFALEDQLADDIEKMHFVLGDKTSKEEWLVAVIDKTIFDTYKSILKTNNLLVVAMIPDFFALPYLEEAWTVLVEKNYAQVRTGKNTGFSIDLTHLSLMLKLSLLREGARAPKRLVIYGQAPEASRYFAEMQAFLPIEFQAIETLYYVVDHFPVNLLPTSYRPKKISGKYTHYWRMVTYFAAAWVLVLCSSLLTRWIYWHEQVLAYEKRIAGVYESIFPGKKDSENARANVQDELDHFVKMDQKNVFMHLFQRSAAVLSQHPATKLNSFSYDNEQMTLQVGAKDLASIEALVSACHQAGLSVKQSQVKMENKNLAAEIVIR